MRPRAWGGGACGGGGRACPSPLNVLILHTIMAVIEHVQINISTHCHKHAKFRKILRGTDRSLGPVCT